MKLTRNTPAVNSETTDYAVITRIYKYFLYILGKIKVSLFFSYRQIYYFIWNFVVWWNMACALKSFTTNMHKHSQTEKMQGKTKTKRDWCPFIKKKQNINKFIKTTKTKIKWIHEKKISRKILVRSLKKLTESDRRHCSRLLLAPECVAFTFLSNYIPLWISLAP